MTSRPWLAGLALVLVGCGSHAASRSRPTYQPQASRTPYRGPTTTSTRPYAPPAPYAQPAPYVAGPTAPGATAAAAPRGPRPTAVPDARFWRGSLDEAVSDARSSGRLVFLEMGRDGCGNCQALRNKVIPDPAIDGPLKALSVGWYDDVDRNRETRARSILYQNLPNAVMLPLAGWVTSDMRWISGFSGRQTTQGFLQEIAKANAIYRQRTEAERPVPRAEMVVVEPTPAPIRVEPASGSLPADEMADVTAALGDDALPAGPAPAAAPEVAAVPAVPPTPPVAAEPPAAAPAPEPVPTPAVPATPPPTETARVEPPAAPAPVAEPPPAPPVVETPAPLPDPVRTWAHQELERAAAALTARDYAAARAILADVRAKAQGLPEQREADKGEVAIRALKKIDREGGDAASRVRTDAAQDLKGTIWALLFA
jgi:hypothetical protein